MTKPVEKAPAASTDSAFAGSIPELYDTLLVPQIFAPYAVDLAARLTSRPLTRVLEVAAGTGVVTRRLALALPDSTAIVATDLNQPMLDRAMAVGTSRPVQWRQADAMRLPFADASFDAVVCQFGAMFFPDRAAAFAEARRVLVAGGVFVLNVWDRIEENDFAHITTEALRSLFPADPPLFLARVPHGYHDRSVIARDLRAGGFGAVPRIETVAARSRAASAQFAARACCMGTPLRSEIEARDPSGLEAACQVAANAIVSRLGSGAVDGKLQALRVEVET